MLYTKLSTILADMPVEPFETFPEELHIRGETHVSCICEGSQDKVYNVRSALFGGVQCQDGILHLDEYSFRLPELCL